ncbi:MAG: 2-amino-5-chlorophenol 1,6-dioxygenase subunit alpha [Actinobacteria bacterium]|nr:2-amino-5-chlorophenol 1,6-dioxygenase subunit alpha [Actinomycetota bacterium]
MTDPTVAAGTSSSRGSVSTGGAPGDVVGVALVPGLPHLLADDPAPSWTALADATRTVGERICAASPDAVVLLSTQWFTVLGHQFQHDPNPRGTYVDENWYAYDYGHLRYDYPVDVDLIERWATGTERAGMQARLTRYDGFPIDTGTIVAGQLLDPDGRLAVAQVSCNLYAPAETMTRLAELGVEAAGHLGRRVVVVAVSGLSSGLIQRWITPDEDRILSAEHDRWNTRMLDLLTAGDVEAALAQRAAYAEAAAVDAQGRALAFLAGAGLDGVRADVVAYGPIWGTGGAVVWWQP